MREPRRETGRIPSGRRTGSNSREGHDRSFLTIKRLYLALSALMILFHASNPRLILEEEHYIRGTIYDATGKTLAYTQVASDGTKIRVYPYGEVFAHVTGYSRRTKTLMELALNEDLLSSSRWQDQIHYLMGDQIQGNSAILTIDGDLQQRAFDLMNGHRGAVIISEPGTGKILALVSTPSYDPNTLSETWDDLVERDDSPLYSRATQGQYPPGSTFKIITSLAAYRTGSLRQFTYTCEGTTTLGTSVLPCYGATAHGTENLADAFANSCNTYFANLGLAIGAEQIRNTAQSLYLNQKIDFDLVQSLSKVVVSDTDSMQMIGETAIGQGQSAITPFSMNMITSIIANDGRLYAPYLLDKVVDTDGDIVRKNLPSLYNNQVITEDEADYLEGLMEEVVTRGTAASLSWLPCQVFGKTGTAQVADGDAVEPHSWFTGYTKVDGQVGIAITVLVENGAESYPALPIVSELLSYYYYR